LKLKSLLSTLCGVLAALALFGIMALTLVDVSGRKLLSTSVTGSLEVTELLLVVVIFAGLPLVSLQSEHVVFDSLDPLIPAWLRRVQQSLVDLLCAAALLGVAWLMWDKGSQMMPVRRPDGPAEAAAGPLRLGDERAVCRHGLRAPAADRAAGRTPPRRDDLSV
jgi:TRAP-type C4-dicarboxylate transport system permease small subunit